MAKLDRLISRLTEVEDASTETFELFSSQPSGRDLGMLEPSSQSIDLTIAGRDFTIKQSPGLLQSNHPGGTTGAALWQTSVHFAQWLAEPSNALFEAGLFGPGSAVLELGSGVAGLVCCVLADRLDQDCLMIASDMGYALKVLRENIASNTSKQAGKRRANASNSAVAKIEIMQYDWEHDDLALTLRSMGIQRDIDVVVACDCIYNYALIEPFVQACEAACRSRRFANGREEIRSRRTVCVFAQQTRQSEVFEDWLNTLLERFKVWRLPTEIAGTDMGEGSGFVVHLAMLKSL